MDPSEDLPLVVPDLVLELDHAHQQLVLVSLPFALEPLPSFVETRLPSFVAQMLLIMFHFDPCQAKLHVRREISSGDPVATHFAVA